MPVAGGEPGGAGSGDVAKGFRLAFGGYLGVLAAILTVVVGLGVFFSLFCCGLCGVFMAPFQHRQAPLQKVQPANPQYRLSGTVMMVDQVNRKLGLAHEGIPGLLPAANNAFDVSDDVAMRDIRHEAKVVCTVEIKGRSWVITRVAPH